MKNKFVDVQISISRYEILIHITLYYKTLVIGYCSKVVFKPLRLQKNVKINDFKCIRFRK